jgi:hypothetical protein
MHDTKDLMPNYPGLYLVVPTHDGAGKAVSYEITWQDDVILPMRPGVWLEGRFGRLDVARKAADKAMAEGGLDRESIRCSLRP